MNKRRKVEISALLIILSLAGLATSAHSGAAAREPAAVSASAESGGYMLRALDGRLAVYAADTDSPMLITDIELSTLRGADRELIEAGLAVADHEALLALLEDLGS